MCSCRSSFSGVKKLVTGLLLPTHNQQGIPDHWPTQPVGLLLSFMKTNKRFTNSFNQDLWKALKSLQQSILFQQKMPASWDPQYFGWKLGQNIPCLTLNTRITYLLALFWNNLAARFRTHNRHNQGHFFHYWLSSNYSIYGFARYVFKLIPIFINKLININKFQGTQRVQRNRI